MTEKEVIKSISDKRSYRALLLDNQMQCLVISDKDAQKSSAALSVGVGSFSDPIEAQGLAHYLEHMLFMGTGKYPSENEYSNFLTKNAGSSNAYTSLEETNFYFEVSHAAFHDGLDRFSRFFIDPLMLDSSSERQLNAVHSEHSKNLQNDMWRKYQLSKHLAKEEHPYHKFSTGDKTTLANPNLREMLFNFYNSHYSANIMKLVVYGQEDVDVLAKSVLEKFKDVKNNQFGKFQIQGHPYGDKVLKKIIKIMPVKDRRVLELTWLLTNQAPHYRYPPSKYVSHILGHQGKGSLLSFLISAGLATALSAGGSDSYNSYSELEVTITLTDKGVAQYREVIGYVFHFIKVLQESEPQEWVVDEIKRINKMKFDFLQKKQGMSYSSSLAKSLHKRSIEELFVFPYLMEEFKPQLIKDYVNQLGTDNLLTMIESQSFAQECTEVEPIYESKFITVPFGDIHPLPCNVALPGHNLFIPDDLSLLPLGTQTLPRKIYESDYIEAFFKEDHEFSLPKAELNFRFYFNGLHTAREEVVRSIFLKMLKEQLREFVYQAEIAELDSSLSISSYYTVNIKVSGFRDSFDRFVNPYLKEILEFIPTDKQLFQTLKDKQTKQYANFFLNSPYQIAYESITTALREGGSTTYIDKLNQVEKVTLEDIASYAKSWKNKIYIELYFTGNTNEEHSLKIAKAIEEFVKSHSAALAKAAIGSIRAVELPAGKVSAVEELLKSKDETNNSLIVHYQYEQENIKIKILQELAHSFVKEPAFDYLRTKEQLGYIVMCLQDDHRGILGLSVLVQSNVKNTYELQKYVSKFINEVLKEKIATLDQKVFGEYKSALLNTKIQKDKSLGAEASRFWAQILKHSYEFARKEKEIQLIPTVTIDQFKEFLHKLFYQNPRVFEIHQIAQSSAEASAILRAEREKSEQNFKVFSSIQSFKKKMALLPDFYSHV